MNHGDLPLKIPNFQQNILIVALILLFQRVFFSINAGKQLNKMHVDLFLTCLLGTVE